ncbi:MAG: cytochrome c [Bryobacterales bacterium]
MRQALLTAGFCGVLLAGCSLRSASPARPLAEPGKVSFNNYCSACHQYDEQGMGEAPPLDKSPWVTGSEERLIRIVLHGVRGPIEVHGKTYNREMPGFGQILSNAEIAAMLSFVRKRFGEPSPEILATSVGQVREATPGRTEYWSVEELLAEP